MTQTGDPGRGHGFVRDEMWMRSDQVTRDGDNRRIGEADESESEKAAIT
jgi:hypothetical protein